MSEVELLYKSDFRGLAGPHPLLVDLRSSEPRRVLSAMGTPHRLSS